MDDAAKQAGLPTPPLAHYLVRARLDGRAGVTLTGPSRSLCFSARCCMRAGMRSSSAVDKELDTALIHSIGFFVAFPAAAVLRVARGRFLALPAGVDVCAHRLLRGAGRAYRHGELD